MTHHHFPTVPSSPLSLPHRPGSCLVLPRLCIDESKVRRKRHKREPTRDEAAHLRDLGVLLRDNILYEDGKCIAINKPEGLAVQGGSGVRASVDELFRRWALVCVAPSF